MDAPLIQIGGSITKEQGKAVTDLIKTVFEVGFKTHMEQETIRAALAAMGTACATTHTTVTNCQLVGEKPQ